MQPLEREGYSREEITEALHGKSGERIIKFRYDLLDRFEKRKRTLNSVMSGTVKMSALSRIKRTGKFLMLDDGNIDWLNDRIQPFFMLRMPAKSRIAPKQFVKIDRFEGTLHYVKKDGDRIKLPDKTKWSDYIGAKWSDL